MAELVWNWDVAPGEAMAKPGLIPAERQGSGCKSQALPGTSPRAFAPSSSGAPGMRRGRERGSLQPGGTGGHSQPGCCQQARLHRCRALGLGQSPAWKCYVGRLVLCLGTSPLCLFFQLIILFDYLFLAAFFSRWLYLFSTASLEPAGLACCCRAEL